MSGFAGSSAAGDGEERLLVPLSALNHFLFCERRCALIHSENVFVTNAFVAQGNRVHERVDVGGYANRRGCRTVRALPLFNDRLGLTGRADLVEFWPRPGGGEEPRPVDYKRGRRAAWDNDRVQLCAQAFCLEEMFATTVRSGSVYHALSRRRTRVDFTADLRRLTVDTIAAVRRLLASGAVPAPVYRPRCHGCSFEDSCLPAQSPHADRLSRYLRDLFQPKAAP
ncbi:MAG: CRISPR-associated protein Cas4 [Dehalococcoidia bacterium]|nr:CRISPR-associated protein Cas4 [Dehalococcoidia bacterium]